MTVVCGTDFSENSAGAARAAAAIAQRLGAPLKLAHVTTDAATEPAAARLRELAAELAARHRIEAEAVVAHGVVDEALLEIAAAAGAGLIVVSSLGGRKQHRWSLGTCAERVAQASTVPVLVVRESESIEAWTRGERPLRVMVGVEIAPTSRAALRWAGELRAIGRCDLLVRQIVWPLEAHSRLGVPPPVPLDHWRPDLQRTLERDLREWTGEVPGEGETTFSVDPGWGRVDNHLALAAVEERADLLVVGRRRHTFAARLWQGSVSRGVLHHAACNVACVPGDEPAQDAIALFRQVLIPTDFSALANRAIPVGYGMVAPGGAVHLIHVVEPDAPRDERDSRERLRSLIPRGAAARGVATEIDVIEDASPRLGILHAAERLGVDAICMATHGRSGVSRALLGSQAQEVVRRSRQPVLLVPAQADA